jgi:glycerol-3-phosphate acyltransferase PlsY
MGGVMDWLWSIAMVAAGYLVGSLSFAIIVSRAMGLADPRSYGSGNPGATNVLRTGNRLAAVIVLALDALKGYAPVIVALLLAERFGWATGTVAMTGLAAFVGHLWPLYFKFHGGKGVATAAGVLFAFNPYLGVGTLASWAIIAAFFRYASLASLVAALFAPFYQLLIWGADMYALAIVAMSALLVWRHRANIEKLRTGRESKIGQKAAAHAAHKTTAHKETHKGVH